MAEFQTPGIEILGTSTEQRGHDFAKFLQEIRSLSHTKVSDAETLLASFAMGVSTGHFSVSRTPVGLKSVQNHVKAAASFAINASHKNPRYRHDQFGNKIGNTYFPALNLFYNSMTKWKKKSSKALLLEINPLSYSYPVSLRHWISFGCRVRIDLV